MEVKVFLENEFDSVLDVIRHIKKTLNPDIFIIFMPYFYFENNRCREISELIGKIDHIILSSVASIKNGDIRYGAVGGAAIKFKKYGFHHIHHKDLISKDTDTSADFLKINSIKENEGTNLLFSTSSNLAVHRILKRAFNNDSNDIRLYGGVASSDAPDFRTYIAVNGEIIEDGFVLLNLHNIESFNTISMGFIPVGTTYDITRARDNKIYALDEIPVVYLLNNILKNTGISPEELDPVKTSEILWEFPFLFTDREGYISHMLVPMMYDPEDGGLAFYGEVSEGEKVKLSTGDSEDILMDVKIKAHEFYRIIKEKNLKPELIINITCTARNYILLGDKLFQKEQEIYYSTLDEYLHTGFLTFGEIGPDKMGKAGKFYNETSILVGLVERWTIE
ncbi:FIST C-terminal domain-containing protein [Persephonella sp.]